MAIQDPVSHVVAIMLENQSFDRLLGCMRTVYPGAEGIDPAAPLGNLDPDSGQAIWQAASASQIVRLDPGHDLDNVLRQIAGGECSGFVADFSHIYPQSTPAERQEVMAYYGLGALPALHALARTYAVCDHWFSSVPGPTWPNRFFVHSGTSLGHTKMPEGFDPNLHIYDQPTVFQRLEERGLPWRIYYEDIPQSLVLTWQWAHAQNYRPLAQFFTDAAGSAESFPAYCFIEPKYFGADADDQHPPHDVMRGEALFASVYNALRANEDLWRSALLVVLHDEHGGFFDHVAPPPAIPPDHRTEEFAFDRYGIRVPALLVSPWVDPSVVSTVFDHTSLLTYLTDKWDLGPLGERVAHANSFAPALLTRTAPRTDTPRSIAVPATARTLVQGDLTPNQRCLLSFSRFLEAVLTPQQPAQVIADRSRRSFEGHESLGQVVRERLDAFLTGATQVAARERPSASTSAA